MKKYFKPVIILAAALFLISQYGCAGADAQGGGCASAPPEYGLDPAAPVIEFTAETKSADGKPEYYLFDDNPEHLNAKYLADGETPSSIVHFENLTPGIYTVFSYHHRGYSVDFWADLYYDAAFSSNGGGSFKIINLGIDKNWDWNQAWADYTNTPVSMPEYLRTFGCACGAGIAPDHADGCPAVVRDQARTPNTEKYTCLGGERGLSAGESAYLSDFESYITENDINHFRYGGWNEPMWMMMKFEVLSGAVNFDTLAYTDKAAAENNFNILLKGPYDNEPQYKGIAENAPIVTAAFEYEINDKTPSGPVPVTVKNSRAPEGITIPDGVFATNVNTWREPLPIAAESDLMRLKYADDTKMSLYGSEVPDGWKNNIWQFDAFHTKHYGNYDAEQSEKIASYGAPVMTKFQPNIDIKDIKHPSGSEVCDDDFYKYNACNLGNFGVTERYEIKLKNSGSKTRKFNFYLSSIAGQVYRYKLTDAQSGETAQSDGGTYIMKKFDDDPPEDPNSKTDPKERLKPDEYGDTIGFALEAGKTYNAVIEITTLTGCVAPMHNRISIE